VGCRGWGGVVWLGGRVAGCVRCTPPALALLQSTFVSVGIPTNSVVPPIVHAVFGASAGPGRGWGAAPSHCRGGCSQGSGREGRGRAGTHHATRSTISSPACNRYTWLCCVSLLLLLQIAKAAADKLAKEKEEAEKVVREKEAAEKAAKEAADKEAADKEAAAQAAAKAAEEAAKPPAPADAPSSGEAVPAPADAPTVGGAAGPDAPTTAGAEEAKSSTGECDVNVFAWHRAPGVGEGRRCHTTHVHPALPALVPLVLQPLQKVHRPWSLQREVLPTPPLRMVPLPALPLLMVPQLLLRMPLHPPLPSLPLPSYWPF
jgi:hypothetical protein